MTCVRFGAVADIRDTWLPPSGALSALGQELPVVTVCDFSGSATCYAAASGRVRLRSRRSTSLLPTYCTDLNKDGDFEVSQYATHEEYVRSVRRQVVSTAQAMLDGQLSFLIGSRRLAALRHETDTAADDADFLVFVVIDSESDALPLGTVREHWDQGALARLEPEIAEAERWASTVGADACRSLVGRFGESEPST